MNAVLKPSTLSRNLLADFRGKQLPNHQVIVSGHIDSWDVGEV